MGRVETRKLLGRHSIECIANSLKMETSARKSAHSHDPRLAYNTLALEALLTEPRLRARNGIVKGIVLTSGP